MSRIPEDLAFKVVASGAAIGTGILVRQGVEAAWSAARGTKPPKHPASPFTDWEEAIGWTVAVGIAVGLGRLLGRRMAAEGWRRARGHLPRSVLLGEG